MRIGHRTAATAAALLLTAISLLTAPGAAADDPAQPQRLTGTVAGVPFAVRLPPNWNGELLLWSHAFTTPGGSPQLIDTDADHPQLTDWLLAHGYALAGTDFPSSPWPTPAMADAQLALVNWFTANVGKPRQVIAWGKSLGGALTAVLAERHPDRITAALPMCGDVAGAVAADNALLDVAFAAKTLLFENDPVQLTGIEDPAANQDRANTLLRAAALGTPQQQARLALANAFGPIPGWADSLDSRPVDPAEQVIHQYLYDRYQIGAFLFGFGRTQLETELGGNPSWTTGVDYRAQLAGSSGRDEVTELYRRAGLDLDADLARLNAAPRIKPDTKAAARLALEGNLTGLITRPTLTLHSSGDGTAPVEAERWYGDRIAALHRSERLRQVYVERANHCFFTAAEELTALQSLFDRLRTGHWPDVSPTALNTRADAYGPGFRTMWSYYQEGTRTVENAFTDLRPGPFPRPFPY